MPAPESPERGQPATPRVYYIDALDDPPDTVKDPRVLRELRLRRAHAQQRDRHTGAWTVAAELGRGSAALLLILAGLNASSKGRTTLASVEFLVALAIVVASRHLLD